MRRTPVLLVGLGLAAGTLAGTGCDTTSEPQAPTVSISPGVDAIDMERAKALAKQAVGTGQVVEIEADNEQGVPVWKVTVVASDGVRHRVSIDRRTGAVLVNETDPRGGSDK